MDDDRAVVPVGVGVVGRRRRGRVVGEGHAGRRALDVLVDRVVLGLRPNGVLDIVREGAGGQGVAPGAGAGRGVENLGARAEAAGAVVPVLVIAQPLDADADAAQARGVGSRVAGVAGDAAGPAARVVEGAVGREADRAGRWRGVVGEGHAGRRALDVLVDRVVLGLRPNGVLDIVREGAGGQGVAPGAGAGRGVENLGARAEAAGAVVPVLVVAKALDRDAYAGEARGVRVRVVGAAGDAAGPAARVVEGAVGREADRAGRRGRVGGEGDASRRRLRVGIDGAVLGLRADRVLDVVGQGAGGQGVAPGAGAGRGVENLGARAEAAGA